MLRERAEPADAHLAKLKAQSARQLSRNVPPAHIVQVIDCGSHRGQHIARLAFWLAVAEAAREFLRDKPG